MCVISILSSFWMISPWFYLLAFIPLSFLGGTCALITGIFCYISDVSFEKDRGFRLVSRQLFFFHCHRHFVFIVFCFFFSFLFHRMARMEAAVFVGLLLGSLSSGHLYKLFSASVVFGCSTFCTFIALMFVCFFVNESIKNQTEETSRMVSWMLLASHNTHSIQFVFH